MTDVVKIAAFVPARFLWGGKRARNFHQADVEFHEALALASGNRVLSYLFEGMASALRESFYASRRGQQMRGMTLKESVAAHAHILACVKSGDAKGASDAMSRLIDDAERDIRAAYGPPVTL